MKHVLVMPDDDPRTAKVVWSEQKGDVTELCIVVDHDPQQQHDPLLPKELKRMIVWIMSSPDAHYLLPRYRELREIEEREAERTLARRITLRLRGGTSFSKRLLDREAT